MKVTILPDRQEREVEARTVADLLKALGMHSDAHLVLRRDEILTRDVRLKADDEVEVWPVISGGSSPRPLRPAAPATSPTSGEEP